MGAPSSPQNPSPLLSQCWDWLRVEDPLLESWPSMPFTQGLGGSFHPSFGLTQRVLSQWEVSL